MTQKVYVGNMSFDTTEERLQELFAAYGQVVSVNVITDRATGRPRGFAFVEMANDAAAQAAIAALSGQQVDGRQLTVAVAKPMERSGDRGGGRDRGGDRGGRDRRW
jgi:cold-inducible RNA-binding protein